MKLIEKTYTNIFIIIFLGAFINVNCQINSGVNTPSNKTKQDSIAYREKILKFKENFYWWETGINKKPTSWFRTDDGIRMAENILSWQDNGTGWPLMSTVKEPFTGDMSKAGPWGKKASLNNATLNEIRFLTRGYNATRDERYLTALLGGLDYILGAQYESGGWPHSYPYRMTDYSHYATFNDDVITKIMAFLGEILLSQEFRVIGEEYKTRVKKAYEKGLDFILKTQIVVDGELTAWAQQYDEETYEPKAARKFEPVAISGGESANVLIFLMNIRKPSQDVINAIEAGVQWYQEVKIDSLELIRGNNDQIVKKNPGAPPIWARYYEIGTNTPIFAGRDGIIRYKLAEIEQERRKGYSWYNYNGTKVFTRYKEWKHERKWDTKPPTNINEENVGDYSLPDPLRLHNGNLVTSSDEWEKLRRPEIMKLFEEYQHGQTPGDSLKTSYEIIERNTPVMDGMAKRTQVRIKFPENQNSPIIRVMLNLPANTSTAVPTLLHISFSPNVLHTDEPGVDEDLAWNVRLKIQVPDKEAYPLKDINIKYFIEQGYGVATVYYGDIEPDFNHRGKYGVRTLFKANENTNEWGAIGAWAWGLSRVMDYLETMPDVDSDQIALSGVSRLGKTVLWAAAQDRRFALIIPMLSGEGGAAISRRNYGETVADLTNPFRYHYWFTPRYTDYAFKVDELPVDGHMLLSLLAPRPVLQIVGSEDTWSDPKGEWESAKACEPVFKLYGRTGLGQDNFVEAGESILHDMGFFMHDGKHTVLPEDFEVMTDFMDKHFTNQAK